MQILLCFFIVTAVLSFVAYRAIKMQEVARENQMMQSYLVSMESFYHMIQNRIEATRRYRHDLAKHIQTLEVMIQQDSKEEYMKCMEELKKGYYQLQQNSYCGDDVINTVLAIKEQQCEEKQIPLELNIKDTVYAAIEEIDMVSLLHNLLDNAIEASEQIPQGIPRGITFAMGKEEKKIWIHTSNLIKPGSEVDFKTWKEEKEIHGLGMKIIDSIIKKYHGKQEINVNSKEGKLEIKIWLECEKIML